MNLTASFFLIGFECATGYNKHGQWMDQIKATRHDDLVEDDYDLVSSLGISMVREGIRWPLVDRRGRYDFSTVEPFVEASARRGIHCIWDLFHFGYPSDVDIFSDEFVKRFADYCYAVGRFIRERTEGDCFFTPVNEPSYMAYAAGDAALFAPYLTGLGWDMKIALARAAIAGIDALRAAAPGCRIVNVDPICRVVAPFGEESEYGHLIDDFNERVVYQSLDLIGGRILPELGGDRDYLDIVGVNYYPCNQWEWGKPEWPLAWDDPRRASLSEILQNVQQRYGGELIISETGERDELRYAWFDKTVKECLSLVRSGFPLRGVCLYPALGMPEWHALESWANMGIWEPYTEDGSFERRAHQPFEEAVRKAAKLPALARAGLELQRDPDNEVEGAKEGEYDAM